MRKKKEPKEVKTGRAVRNVLASLCIYGCVLILVLYALSLGVYHIPFIGFIGWFFVVLLEALLMFVPFVFALGLILWRFWMSVVAVPFAIAAAVFIFGHPYYIDSIDKENPKVVRETILDKPLEYLATPYDKSQRHELVNVCDISCRDFVLRQVPLFALVDYENKDAEVWGRVSDGCLNDKAERIDCALPVEVGFDEVSSWPQVVYDNTVVAMEDVARYTKFPFPYETKVVNYSTSVVQGEQILSRYLERNFHLTYLTGGFTPEWVVRIVQGLQNGTGWRKPGWNYDSVPGRFKVHQSLGEYPPLYPRSPYNTGGDGRFKSVVAISNPGAPIELESRFNREVVGGYDWLKEALSNAKSQDYRITLVNFWRSRDTGYRYGFNDVEKNGCFARWVKEQVWYDEDLFPTDAAPAYASARARMPEAGAQLSCDKVEPLE